MTTKKTSKSVLAALSDDELRAELKRRDDLVAEQQRQLALLKEKEREKATYDIATKFEQIVDNLRHIRKVRNEHDISVSVYDFYQAREILEELDALDLMPIGWSPSSIGC